MRVKVMAVVGVEDKNQRTERKGWAGRDLGDACLRNTRKLFAGQTAGHREITVITPMHNSASLILISII